MNLLRFLTLTAILAGSAIAGTIYDNTSQATAGWDPTVYGGSVEFPIIPYGPLYNSFTATSNSRLTGLSLLLQIDPANVFGQNADTSHAFTVGIYSNVTGGSGPDPAPGSLIATLATIQDSILTNSAVNYSITLGLNPILAAGTRYWIGLNGGTTSIANWDWDGTNDGTGVGGEFFNNSTATGAGDFGTAGGTYQMRVSTTDIADGGAPEPTTMLLLGTGLGLIGLMGRRLRR